MKIQRRTKDLKRKIRGHSSPAEHTSAEACDINEGNRLGSFFFFQIYKQSHGIEKLLADVGFE